MLTLRPLWPLWIDETAAFVRKRSKQLEEVWVHLDIVETGGFRGFGHAPGHKQPKEASEESAK